MALVVVVPPALLRLPFITINAIMGYISTSPPNKATNDEKKKYDLNNRREPISAMSSWYVPAFQLSVHIMNVSEFYVILAALFPPIRSTTLLSILLAPGSSIESMKYRLHVTPLLVLGATMCAFGSLLRLACYQYLGKSFTFELSIQKDHRLVTGGPYAFVRHPGYLGVFCTFIGLLLCQFSAGSWWVEGNLWTTTLGKVFGSWWIMVVIYSEVALVIFRSQREDEVMKKEFGKEWLDWAKRTPYRVFPGIY